MDNNVRKLWIEDVQTGSTFDMNDERHFLTDITGLGRERVYNQVEISNYVNVLNTSNHYDVQTISGNLIFTGDTLKDRYESKNSFIDFWTNTIESSHLRTELRAKLWYWSPGEQEAYYCYTDIMGYDFSEQNENYFEIPVAFLCLSPWLKPTSFVLDNQGGDKKPNDYNMIYPFRYADVYSASEVTTEYINQGQEQAPYIIKIEGPCINPAYKVNDVLVSLDVSLALNETLEIHSIPNARVIDLNGEENTQIYNPFFGDPWFQIPRGKNIIMIQAVGGKFEMIVEEAYTRVK